MKLVLFALACNLPNAQALATKLEKWAKLSVFVADYDDIKLVRRQKCKCVNLIIYHLPKTATAKYEIFSKCMSKVTLT